MNEETLKLMRKLEEVVTELEERTIKRVDIPKKEKMEETCYNVLGYKEHMLWHVNFNAHKFKDVEDFYNFDSIWMVKSYNKRVSEILEKVTSNVDDLFLIYNKYLIDKEKGKE